MSKEPDIFILGLGPGDPGLLTLKAAELIQSAERIYLRTSEHPTVSSLPPDLDQVSFDDLYQQEKAYESVYEHISQKIIKLAKESPGLIYAVPGDPFTAEATPAMICALAEEDGLVVEVIPGVSFLEPTFSALSADPLPQINILDAHEMQTAYFPAFPPDQPALIAQVSSKKIASDVKLVLNMIFPDDHLVHLVHDAGTEDELVESIPLYELDRSQRIENRTSLFVPPLPKGSSMESFQEIIAHLRSPEGCPWDREQDHQTLRPNLLEEAYETLEAIDRDDPDAMKEEFGDLLLQIVLHAQIGNEYGEFTMSDIIHGIQTKLIQRHPHVFSDLNLDQADAVIKNWEAIKAQERELNGEIHKGLLDGVPKSLPALTQAVTYQKRAARVGFDWKDLQAVLDKIPEEINELMAESTRERQSAEIGDLLFSVVNVARWLEVDAESALRDANQRFKKRFKFIEKKARAEERELSSMDLDELDQLWEQSKTRLDD